MILHNDEKAFLQLIMLTSQKYNIQPVFIEKDYWITLILQKLSRSNYADLTVFKGGTSLSKAYGLIYRFSEDVDLAICHTEDQSGNNIKNIIRNIEKSITIDFTEAVKKGITSKGSRFRKSVYGYDSIIGKSNLAQNNVIVEINSFANPYPFVSLEIESFIAQFLREASQNDVIEQYDLSAFTVNVLDKRQTLIEKLVSLVRFSHLGIEGISSKIRHFYDFHYLLQNAECKEYITNGSFKADFESVLSHDKEMFEDPKGWQDVAIKDIPLFNDTERVWSELTSIYRSELSGLAFEEIPDEKEVLHSFTLIKTMLSEH